MMAGGFHSTGQLASSLPLYITPSPSFVGPTFNGTYEGNTRPRFIYCRDDDGCIGCVRVVLACCLDAVPLQVFVSPIASLVLVFLVPVSASRYRKVLAVY